MKGLVTKDGAEQFRRSLCGTGATLEGCDHPCHADPERARPPLRGASRPMLLVTRDGRQRSSWSVRRVVSTPRRAGRHGAFLHGALASIHVPRAAPMLLPGRKRFLARERESVSSQRVEHSGGIFGLEGLGERGDSMRSRASLPFGPALSFGRWSSQVNAA